MHSFPSPTFNGSNDRTYHDKQLSSLVHLPHQRPQTILVLPVEAAVRQQQHQLPWGRLRAHSAGRDGEGTPRLLHKDADANKNQFQQSPHGTEQSSQRELGLRNLGPTKAWDRLDLHKHWVIPGGTPASAQRSFDVSIPLLQDAHKGKVQNIDTTKVYLVKGPQGQHIHNSGTTTTNL